MPSRVTKPWRKPKPIKAPKTLELNFDVAARQDYLTGFSKRKKARAQAAKDSAIQREKEERVRTRQELRKERKIELEEHVAAVRKEMKRQNRILDGELTDVEDEDEDGDDDGWGGIAEGDERDGEQKIVVDGVDNEEEEYVDEDRYTTVTVEAMGDDDDNASDDEESTRKRLAAEAAAAEAASKKKKWDRGPKVRKQKFRYESKLERSAARSKQKAKNAKAAKARRGED